MVCRWQRARAAAVIGECGTGKTLVALAAIHCHSEGRPYTALAMVPGHLTAKTAREAFRTLPGVRVFFIDALRDRVRDGFPCGINEVKLRHGKIVREGLHTTLTDLRLRNNYKSARQRWQQEICSGPALFIVGRDRSKLGWFWRHAYEVARCGRYQGSVVIRTRDAQSTWGTIACLPRTSTRSVSSGGSGLRPEDEPESSCFLARVSPGRGRLRPLWAPVAKRRISFQMRNRLTTQPRANGLRHLAQDPPLNGRLKPFQSAHRNLLFHALAQAPVGTAASEGRPVAPETHQFQSQQLAAHQRACSLSKRSWLHP